MTATLQPAVDAPPNLPINPKEQDYLFDLCGYRILKNALSPDQLRHINAFADQHDTPTRKPGDWIGNVEVHTYGAWQTPRLWHEDGSVAEW